MRMATDYRINGINFKIHQINGQKICESVNYHGPPPPSNTEIYVRNIPVDWSEQQLLPLFTIPGFVLKMRLMMVFSGDNRGFCYVQYATTEMAINALNYLKSQPISGLFLFSTWSHDNKNLVLTGISRALNKEGILSRICFFVKPTEIEFRHRINETVAIVKFATHREAALSRRTLILHVQEFGKNACLGWLKPNSLWPDMRK